MSVSSESNLHVTNYVGSDNKYTHPNGAACGWWTDDDMLYIQVGSAKHQNGAAFTESDALNLRDVVDHLTSERDSFVELVDIRNLRRTTAKARRISPNEKARRIAMLVKSRVSRMLGNAYLGINRRLPCPTRLFTSEQEAIHWLMKSDG